MKTHYFDRAEWSMREIYYREAMVNLLLERVTWIDIATPQLTPPVDDDFTTNHIGLIEACDPGSEALRFHPLVILHDTADDRIALLTAFEVALWPAATVARFPGLEEYLLAHVDVGYPMRRWVDEPSNTPRSDSWLVHAGWTESDGMLDLSRNRSGEWDG